MTPIPIKLRSELNTDPYYKICARYKQHGHECGGKITFEHTVIFAGKQVQEKWAIIPLCEKAHAVNGYQDGGDLDKEINVWIALNRASHEDLMKVSKAINYTREKARLNEIYGTYIPVALVETPKILKQVIVPEKTTPFIKKFTAKKSQNYWVPLSKEHQNSLKVAIEHHKEMDDMHFSPFDMLYRMIDEYVENLDLKAKRSDQNNLEINY